MLFSWEFCIKLLLPTFKLEKKYLTGLGQSFIETNISLPTQFLVHTWSKHVVCKIILLGFGIQFKIQYKEFRGEF